MCTSTLSEVAVWQISTTGQLDQAAILDIGVIETCPKDLYFTGKWDFPMTRHKIEVDIKSIKALPLDGSKL